ncbi:MAG: papain-like cysteine peptidase [Parachlamydiales bacterium]|nr:papain-like cysteine peptidase [Parachlamydiales bacterium]
MNLRLFFFLLFASWCLQADLLLNDVKNDAPGLEIANKPIFVSLGSSCVPAGILRQARLRSAAFPLDWLFSLDNQGLIRAIRGDFEHFLNDDFLIPDNFLIPEANGASLVHFDYHFQFLHEGDFFGSKYEQHMQGLKERYQRRIERFRALAEYPGTVIFLRCSYEFALSDFRIYYKCQGALDISDEDSTNLFLALKERFPKMKMKLIIINQGAPPLNGIEIEKILQGEIIKVRHYYPTYSEMFSGFGDFLIQNFQYLP